MPKRGGILKGMVTLRRSSWSPRVGSQGSVRVGRVTAKFSFSSCLLNYMPSPGALVPSKGMNGDRPFLLRVSWSFPSRVFPA